MSGKIINLRSHRKRTRRQEAEARAEENRVRFGRTKGARKVEDGLQEREDQKHRGHRLDPDDVLE
ncbi:MAG: DUF4169 family protein [Rhodospirillaceae bacterium]|nr:DUF4169 family protein [Rhodospirillaceae bacterium]MBT6137442.1 DUF4169 family protein [Rhodospirillaceae bacterium]